MSFYVLLDLRYSSVLVVYLSIELLSNFLPELIFQAFRKFPNRLFSQDSTRPLGQYFTDPRDHLSTRLWGSNSLIAYISLEIFRSSFY